MGLDSYRYVIVPLNNDHTLFIEYDDQTLYDVWLLPGTITRHAMCQRPYDDEKQLLDNADEFETQMLLDHYIESIGRKKFVRKPSGDTQVT